MLAYADKQLPFIIEKWPNMEMIGMRKEMTGEKRPRRGTGKGTRQFVAL
jgi:hypothetical protein